MDYAKVSELVGKTLSSVVGDKYSINFTTEDGTRYEMYHDQDCCECVYIENICGELKDLEGSPLTMAEEAKDVDLPPLENDGDYSFTWTVYTFATVKGQVTVRWYGSSNGYYSESVSFYRM